MTGPQFVAGKVDALLRIEGVVADGGRDCA